MEADSSGYGHVSSPMHAPQMSAGNSGTICLIDDMASTFPFANEIIKSMDDAALFNLEEGLEYNFDIDQLEEATNHVINGPNAPTLDHSFKMMPCNNNDMNKCVQKVDEFMNDYMKVPKNGMAHCVKPVGQSDPELINIFDYTSQFNVNEDERRSMMNLRCHASHQGQHNSVELLNDSCSMSSSSCSSSTPSMSSMVSPEKLAKQKLDLVIEGQSIKQPKWWSTPAFEHRLSSSHHLVHQRGEDDECDSGLYNQYMNTYQHIPNPSTVDLKDIFDTGASLSFDQSFNLISNSSSYESQPKHLTQQEGSNSLLTNSSSSNSTPSVYSSYEITTSKPEGPSKKRSYANRSAERPNSEAIITRQPVSKAKKEKYNCEVQNKFTCEPNRAASMSSQYNPNPKNIP